MLAHLFLSRASVICVRHVLLQTSLRTRCPFAAMSTVPALPSIVVYSQFIDGPRGIRECMRNTCEEIYQQCRFIDCGVPFSEDAQEGFRKADVILLDPDLLPALMDKVESVKWVQSTWAGVDGFINNVDHSLLPPKFVLTRFAGIFGDHLSEYVICQILAHERHLNFLLKAQEKKKWALDEYTTMGYHLLKDRTISILGAGDIGTQIAKVCKVFKMRVIGLVRKDLPLEKRSSAFDEFRRNEDLSYVLGEADFIVNLLPSTELTVNFLSGDTLSHCKKKPVFINVGRGDIISTESVADAITKGWISHAILDVTWPEPLPQDSPLWTMPQVTITPHVSAQSHGPEITQMFYENYQRYVKGEPLRYQIDWKEKY